MNRTRIAALALSAGVLALTGCAQDEPQVAETVTVTATPTPESASSIPAEPAAEPKASPTDAGFTITPEIDYSVDSDNVYFIARWLPDNESDTTPVEGIVTVLVDGAPTQVDMEASLPARPVGIDYYMTGFKLNAGSEVGMRVSVLDDAFPGTLECTISLEGAGEPLVRETSAEFQDTGVPIASCEGVVP